jgi:hypothetical protein
MREPINRRPLERSGSTNLLWMMPTGCGSRWRHQDSTAGEAGGERQHDAETPHGTNVPADWVLLVSSGVP